MKQLILFLVCSAITFIAATSVSQDLLGVIPSMATPSPTPANTASGEVAGGGLDGDAP